MSSGLLHLVATKESTGDKTYTGAGIISTQAFRYGFYQARFKVPPGKGWHSSFWMKNHDYKDGIPSPGQELDVCENDSIHLTRYGVNVHKWVAPDRSFGGKKIDTPDLSTDYHTWGCEFTATEVRYFFQGELVQTVDVTGIEHFDQHIWLTTIISRLGRAKTVDVDDARLPSEFTVDWVRFYRHE